MKRKQRLMSVFLVLLGCAGALFWALWWPKTYTITVRTNGFTPDALTIPAGSTVRFAGKGDRAFWPASNFHPSHKLYPEFDARTPIAATASWSFTFDTPGIWRFHDHLNSRSVGTITVRQTPFVKTKNLCQGDIALLPVKVQEGCWIQEIESILAAQGLDRAFERFGQLYETKPAFSSDCHDVTHLLGEAAYRAYVQDGAIVTSQKTSFCGYGFYHGFIEALLFTTGNFNQAKSYCRDVQKELAKTIVSPNAIYACYHGLGHGTFDTQNFSQWGNDEKMLTGAINVCEEVTRGEEEELVKQCASGVFNALANAYGNKSYNLSYDDRRPFRSCEIQTNIRYKEACYREVASAYIRTTFPRREEALLTISHIPDAVGADATMFAYMSDEARLGIDTMTSEKFADVCRRLPSDHLRRSCVEGVVAGLFLWGKPGAEEEKAIAFCRQPAISRLHKEACYSYVLPRLRTIYPSGRVSAICDTVEPVYQHYCL